MKNPLVLAKGVPEPPFYNDKTFKVTMTGVTRLKEGRYASRYRVSPGYQVTAKGEIIVKEKPPGKKSPGKKDPAQVGDKKNYGIAKMTVRNRMRAMVNMLRSCVDRLKKPKLYFFTITFQEGTRDSDCYRILNTWLTGLRQKKLLHSYLWVAERQKNGTIHFHMAVPHYMNAPRVNRIMKNILLDLKNKGGLTHWERSGIVKYNGVHISKNKKTGRPLNFAASGKDKSLTHYLTKYITKNETTMQHLAWHCSRDWSALVVGMTFTREELAKFITGRMLDSEILETDYCQFFRWSNYKPPEKFSLHLGNINYELLRHVTGNTGEYLYQLN